MAFKTFAPGVLTSSDVNTFLMRQSVITCTAATRPASPNEGMLIYETDTDLFKVYSGTAWVDMGEFVSGAWISFTPTIRSFGAGTDWVLGNATFYGYYQKLGNVIAGHAGITWGSTTTFGTKSVSIDPPLLPENRGGTGSQIIGNSICYDISLANSYMGALIQSDGVPGRMRPSAIDIVTGTYGANTEITSTVPFTWATGDELLITFAYEAA
jgi:hypothetical protein